MRSLAITLVLICFMVVLGCAEPFPAGPALVAPPQEAAAPAPAAEAVKEKPAGCLVRGRVTSAAWAEMGGGIERAIVSAWTLPERERVEEVYGKGESFEVRLLPGRYRLTFSANGTRGATFEVANREIMIEEGQGQLDVEKVDLPISRTTSLYGKPAPDLEGIIAWKDVAPTSLKDLKGKVVVLDFFAYYCSICHAHKPDLVKLRDAYQDRGLVVVAVHDSTLETMDEVNEKMEPILRRIFDGKPPKLPIALDGQGKDSVFQAYGIFAVPAVILIDQQGRVVRRYHHAGKPELEADVKTLLTVPGQLR